jgi:catalase (peroxidase I)
VLVVEAAPGPVGAFLEVTTLAYDNDACRGAGFEAVTAAVEDAWPLAVGVFDAAVVEADVC